MTKNNNWTPQKLDEDKKDEKRRTFSISLNKHEEKLLEQIKEVVGLEEDGKALKIFAFLGYNVLHSMFGRRFLECVFKRKQLKTSEIDILE